MSSNKVKWLMRAVCWGRMRLPQQKTCCALACTVAAFPGLASCQADLQMWVQQLTADNMSENQQGFRAHQQPPAGSASQPDPSSSNTGPPSQHGPRGRHGRHQLGRYKYPITFARAVTHHRVQKLSLDIALGQCASSRPSLCCFE